MSKEIAIKWYRQARHDLEMAEKNISIEGYDVTAFLAHQAVEKLLKSVFALLGNKIPKIHYIDELARELNLPPGIVDDILDLTGDYTFSRYPDVSDHTPYEEYDETVAREKVKKAKTVFYEIKKQYRELAGIE